MDASPTVLIHAPKEARMTPRYLTKSRFKLALECPTKLFYTGNPAYVDKSSDNSFLAALAEGGYQVGALACAMFPGGIEVVDIGHAAQLERTRELLQRDEVTIFEAALEAQGLFVHVDVLRKQGDLIEIIEVKAKSFDPAADGDFRDRRGRLRSSWLPYLHDVAFQCHVARLALPNMTVRSQLMLADKSAVATVDGLNQRFPLQRHGNRLRVAVAPGTDVAVLGSPILVRVPVDVAVSEIHAGALDVGGTKLPFDEAVIHLTEAYRDGHRLTGTPGAQCGDCQFRSETPPAEGQLRSGFHECWSSAFGWSNEDFAGGTVLDVWNLRKKGELIAAGVLKPKSLTLDDLGHDEDEPNLSGMTRKHRQWYQCHGGWPEGGEFFLDAEGMAAAMSHWRWPLHFIDFETCAVAIPFDAGRQPYETIAFQFSHHVMHENGRVEHNGQFLEATPRVDPCLPFLRALRTALFGDEGTVFRWAAHENTVLNQLRRSLLADAAPPADRDELVAFIESITTRDERGGKGRVVIAGPRSMVDLCKLAERHYFHPQTKGSSSLKKVLPALMRSTPRLRELYEAATYGGPGGIPSLNFHEPMAWWVAKPDGNVNDPYDLLPPVFADLSREEQERLESSIASEMREGGAAMTAYARLQFEEIGADERKAICAALLKYCELDTLAMVIAVQAFQRLAIVS